MTDGRRILFGVSAVPAASIAPEITTSSKLIRSGLGLIQFLARYKVMRILA
jgi:hypothetical protein